MLDVVTSAMNYYVVAVLIIMTFSLIKAVKKEGKSKCCQGKEVCTCEKNNNNCSCNNTIVT